jgi:predicted RNA-binding Zn-ribbon protein involved in translation (DUF1610 family)
MDQIISLEQWREDHREYPCDLCSWEGIANDEQPKVFPDADLAYCWDCGTVFCRRCEQRHDRECEFNE